MEERLKQSAAAMGKKHTAARRMNISLGQAKIPDSVIVSVRGEYALGNTQQKLAKKYNIGQAHVSRIIRRECYSWVA